MNFREFLAKVGFQIEGTDKLENADALLTGIKHRLDALIAIDVIKGMAELAEKFAHFGIELQVAANNAGISVESFQKLAQAAEQSNVSAEEMSNSIFRLSRRIYEAKIGNQQATESFRRLGITRDQIFSFNNAQDALLAISDRLKNIPDQFQKMALMQQLAGRGSKQMIDFLSKGSGAILEQGQRMQELGTIISGTEVNALVKLEHALLDIGNLFKSLAATIASKLAPIFETIIDDFLEFQKGTKDWLSLNLDDAIGDLAAVLGFLWGFMKGLLVDFKYLVEHLHLTKDGVLTVIEVMAAAIAVATTLAATLKIVAFTLAALSSPIILIIGLVTELIIVIHDLFALATGGKTWTGQILDWLASFKALHNTIQGVRDTYKGFVDLIEGTIGVVAEGAKALVGRGSGRVFGEEVVNIGRGAFNVFKGGAEAVSGGFAAAGGIQYGPSTQINVNVPPGSDGKAIADHVKDAIDEHHQKMLRELQRGVSTPVGQ